MKKLLMSTMIALSLGGLVQTANAANISPVPLVVVSCTAADVLFNTMLPGPEKEPVCLSATGNRVLNEAQKASIRAAFGL